MLKKTSRYVYWCWKSVCVTLFRKKHARRDVIVIFSFIIIVGLILGVDWHLGKKIEKKGVSRTNIKEPQVTEQDEVQKEENDVAIIQSHFDTSSWTPYQNLWYGFSLKYPREWTDPVIKKPTIGDMWEQKIEFRMNETKVEDPFEGFDVEVYSISRVKEVSNTDEFPKLKNSEMSGDGQCANIDGHLLETGQYPAEEIYVPISDACYNAALFFTNTRGNYIYTIAPKLKEGAGLAGDPAKEIASHMPEFFSVAQMWNLIDIQRPKPAMPKSAAPMAKPAVNAPMPVSYDTAGGRLVCAKSNDHPAKSDQHKGKHMDMECCLDPDEYPNPHCYYPPSKYGKYL
ncbi:MAG: hypothetical protein WCV59_03990 [Parcubacteria group bacterium]|jgi:hypothetical protein